MNSMTLFMNNTSPYARIVRVVLDQFQLQENQDYKAQMVMPHARPSELLAVNPLSKIPVLITENDETLIDSIAICQYLLTRFGKTLPQVAEQLIGSCSNEEAFNKCYIAHGLIDYTVNLVLESRRPEDKQFADWKALMNSEIERILSYIENNLLTDSTVLDLFSIILISALDFIDFRLNNHWQSNHPKLAIWQRNISTMPVLQKTYPKE